MVTWIIIMGINELDRFLGARTLPPYTNNSGSRILVGTNQGVYNY